MVYKILNFLSKKISFFKIIKKHVIFKKIEKYYCDIDIRKETISDNIKTIWLYWGQGFEKAPELVKKCVYRIQKYSKEYKVILLDDNTISKYVDIPQYIYKKLNEGKITKTHFSDILRINLLSKYGGIWMDPTIFVGESFTDTFISHNKIISIPQLDVNYSVSEGKWSAWLIGTLSSPEIFTSIKVFFNNYWEKETKLIDYFLIDYILEYIYENDMVFKNEIDNLTYPGYSVYDLINLRNSNCTEDEFNEFLNINKINKMSYKVEYDVENKNTFSHYIFDK